jgi:hypothetical protein
MNKKGKKTAANKVNKHNKEKKVAVFYIPLFWMQSNVAWFLSINFNHNSNS